MVQLDDRLYTSTEVADILGVSLRSVYRYIEENKLQAEVKTATGRHRFTKKNIVDFLYPDGTDKGANARSSTAASFSPRENTSLPSSTYSNIKKQVDTSASMSQKVPVSSPVSFQQEATPVENEEKNREEAPVDWLAKFREAAKKFETEKNDVVSKSMQEDIFPDISASSKISEVPSMSKQRSFYYKSRLGGLKDIAQNIDKVASNSNLDYAFTLNAGLSLYKPIKPFSLLHVYIRSRDKDFFERVLMLTPVDVSNAQLSLIVTDEDALYENVESLHGLHVVSKRKLLEDIRNSNDRELLDESANVLK